MFDKTGSKTTSSITTLMEDLDSRHHLLTVLYTEHLIDDDVLEYGRQLVEV